MKLLFYQEYPLLTQLSSPAEVLKPIPDIRIKFWNSLSVGKDVRFRAYRQIEQVKSNWMVNAETVTEDEDIRESWKHTYLSICE